MKKNRRGFSLIELMIVVGIIGILAAIAMPSYQTYTRRARFTEVIAATQPFKTAVALALQDGAGFDELHTGAYGIPSEPLPTRNLASLTVDKGVITATGTDKTGNATYILRPSADGSIWTVEGSCLSTGLCES